VGASKSTEQQRERTEQTSPVCTAPPASGLKGQPGKVCETSKTHNFSTIRTVVLLLHQNVILYAGTSVTAPSVTASVTRLKTQENFFVSISVFFTSFVFIYAVEITFLVQNRKKQRF